MNNNSFVLNVKFIHFVALCCKLSTKCTVHFLRATSQTQMEMLGMSQQVQYQMASFLKCYICHWPDENMSELDEQGMQEVSLHKQLCDPHAIHQAENVGGNMSGSVKQIFRSRLFFPQSVLVFVFS